MFKCENCEKEFKSGSALRGHKRMHGNSKGKYPDRVIYGLCTVILTRDVIRGENIEKYFERVIPCKNCGSLFKETFNEKFCCHSCSATYTNKHRAKPVYRKKEIKCRDCSNTNLVDPRVSSYTCEQCSKIRRLLNKSRPKDKPLSKSRKTYLKTKRQTIDSSEINYFIKIAENTCKSCGSKFYNRTYRKYCETCKGNYCESNKMRFKFTFNVYHYPELFDLKRIETIGWYSGNDFGRRNKNLSGLCRDHKVSVAEAIKNNYDPHYITHPLNCFIMTHEENLRKGQKSSISYEELKRLVDSFESKPSIQPGYLPR